MELAMKYFAVFKYKAMELENESDDLVSIKKWIADLLAEYPDPDYICIRDEEYDKVIFNEEYRKMKDED
jgi:hypothetical protein